MPEYQGQYFEEHGSGSPLLLIHGLMATGQMFEPVVETLAARHRLIIPDLRGHGRSREMGPPYTVERLSADLAGLLGHLGISSLGVLGYSQGGAIAQQLALDDPGLCRRLVLACTYAFNMASLREKLEGHLVPILLHLLGIRSFARMVISQGLKQVDPGRRKWVMDIIAGQDKDLMIQAWKETMAFDSRPRLKEIHCPTLILAGSKDDAVPLHHARALHAGIPGSKLTIAQGADHAFIWARPHDFAAHVTEFLG